MSSYLEWKKRALIMGSDGWWIPQNFDPSDCLCAFDFKNAGSRTDAMTDLTGHGYNIDTAAMNYAGFHTSYIGTQTQPGVPGWWFSGNAYISSTLGLDTQSTLVPVNNGVYALDSAQCVIVRVGGVAAGDDQEKGLNFFAMGSPIAYSGNTRIYPATIGMFRPIDNGHTGIFYHIVAGQDVSLNWPYHLPNTFGNFTSGVIGADLQTTQTAPTVYVNGSAQTLSGLTGMDGQIAAAVYQYTRGGIGGAFPNSGHFYIVGAAVYKVKLSAAHHQQVAERLALI